MASRAWSTCDTTDGQHPCFCPTLSLTKSLNSWAISRAEFNVPGQTPTARLVYRFCRSSLYHKSGLNFCLSPGHENQINGRGYPMLQFRRPLCRRCLYLRHSRPLSQRAGFANVQQVKLKKPWVKYAGSLCALVTNVTKS